MARFGELSLEESLFVLRMDLTELSTLHSPEMYELHGESRCIECASQSKQCILRTKNNDCLSCKGESRLCLFTRTGPAISFSKCMLLGIHLSEQQHRVAIHTSTFPTSSSNSSDDSYETFQAAQSILPFTPHKESFRYQHEPFVAADSTLQLTTYLPQPALYESWATTNPSLEISPPVPIPFQINDSNLLFRNHSRHQYQVDRPSPSMIRSSSLHTSRSTTSDPERPHPCNRPQCKSKFKHIGTLNRHIRSIHGSWKTASFECASPGCSKYYKTWHRYDHFRDHCRRTHGSCEEGLEALIKKLVQPMNQSA
jgi:hypothetical protein